MFMTAAIKSVLILLSAVPLVIFLGNELGNGEFLLPALICALVILCLLGSVLFRDQRVECLVVAFLLAGYIVGNRGFAQLYLVQPLFVGEVGLVVVVLALLGRFVLARESIHLEGLLPRLVLTYLFVGSIRFAFDVQSYRIDAVRDFATIYYSVFFFVALQLGRQEHSSWFLGKVLTWAFFLQTIVSVVAIVRPDWLEVIEIRGVPLLTQKGDLTPTFSAMGLLFFFLRPDAFGSKWLRRTVIIVLLLTIILAVSRAALVALAISSLLLWLAGQRRFFAYPVAMAATGLFCLLAASVVFQDSAQTERVMEVQEKLASIVDFSNSRAYSSAMGEMKGANNEFRTALWHSMVDETLADNPVFGKGFGFDFITRFEQTYGRGRWEGLRSAHNYYVTIFGRMGAVGFAVLLTLTALIAQGGLNAAAAVRRGRLGLDVLTFWCCAWVILIAGAFGVVMEGPMGAIPFWLMLGLAVAGSRASEEALRRESVPVALPLLERPRELVLHPTR